MVCRDKGEGDGSSFFYGFFFVENLNPADVTGMNNFLSRARDYLAKLFLNSDVREGFAG